MTLPVKLYKIPLEVSMRKIITQILSICLLFCLSSCSQKVNKNDVIEVFDALDRTLEVDSGILNGTLITETENRNIIDLDVQFIQNGNLRVAANMDLTSGKNTIENYIEFYIVDGKTYLKNMDTTSQSVLENIGLSPNSKISVYNIFLDYSDDQLVSLFESSSRKGNVIQLKLNNKQLSTLLDSMGTLSISKGEITVTLNDEYIENIKLDIQGYFAYDTISSDLNIQLDCDILNINALKNIALPADLDSY